MNVRRSIALSRLAVLAGAALAPSAPALGQSAQPIAIAMPGADDGTPLLYAIASGALKKAGIEVTLTPGASGAAVSAAVAGGAVNIGISSLVPLIGAHSHGLPFQLLAPAAVYNSDAAYAAMVVRSDSPIRSAKDLNGRTIASAALRDLIGTSNLAWIDQNGGDSATVKTVEIPNTALLPALEDGRIDAGTFLEPRLSEALDTGKMRILGKSFDAYGKRFPISAWFATAEYVAKNTDLVVRFAHVMRDANAYCNTHHAETAVLLADWSKVDLKVIQKSVRVGYGDALALKEIQGVIDVSAKYKVIEKAFDAKELVSPAVSFLTR